MKTVQALIVGGSILMVLTACSTSNDSTQTSQDSIQVEGIAATGYAMVAAELQIRSASGDVLYSGQTNLQGEYSANLAKDTSLYPLQIQVQQGEYLFRHILVLSGGEGSANCRPFKSDYGNGKPTNPVASTRFKKSQKRVL